MENGTGDSFSQDTILFSSGNEMLSQRPVHGEDIPIMTEAPQCFVYCDDIMIVGSQATGVVLAARTIWYYFRYLLGFTMSTSRPSETVGHPSFLGYPIDDCSDNDQA